MKTRMPSPGLARIRAQGTVGNGWMDGWTIEQLKLKEGGFWDGGDLGSEMCHFSPKKV